MHAQAEAVQEALPAQLTAVGLHPTVHLPAEDKSRGKHDQTSDQPEASRVANFPKSTESTPSIIRVGT